METGTILSTSSIEEGQALFEKWLTIPGNENRSLSDFYNFLTVDSPKRNEFMSMYTILSYEDIKANIVVVKTILKK